MQCPTIFRKYAKLKIKLRSPPKAWLLLAFLLLQGIDQKPDNKCCFSKRKILATFTLWNSLWQFHMYSSSFFCWQWGYDEATCGSRRMWELKLDTKLMNEKFINVYTPECDGSTEESLTLLKGSYSQKAYNSLKQNNLESDLWISYN
jgi:hypothetical protein